MRKNGCEGDEQNGSHWCLQGSGIFRKLERISSGGIMSSASEFSHSPASRLSRRVKSEDYM